LPKTLITENTLTTTVATIEITSGITYSYKVYEFLVMNGQVNVSNSVTSFLIGQSGTYNVRDNSITKFGPNQNFNTYFGPVITNSTGVNLLMRAVIPHPDVSGTYVNKAAFVHAVSNYDTSAYASSIILAETTVNTSSVDRVKLTVSGGSWLAGTRYKLYGYE
jgi:hypothetical protein